MFDNRRIHEVVSNLLINAIKYSPPGGKIIITSEKKDNIIAISIRDLGIGLITDGAGLGLYFSDLIIKMHGGQIWAESEGRDKGSTFSFTLPMNLK